MTDAVLNNTALERTSSIHDAIRCRRGNDDNFWHSLARIVQRGQRSRRVIGANA